MNSLPLRIVAPSCCARNRSATRQAARARGPAPPALARPDRAHVTRPKWLPQRGRATTAAAPSTCCSQRQTRLFPRRARRRAQSARRWWTVQHRAPQSAVSAVFLALQIFDRVSRLLSHMRDRRYRHVLGGDVVIVASLSLALKRERRDNMITVAECVNVANTHFLNVNRVPSTPTDVVQMETKIMFELDWSFQLTPHCAAALWAEALGVDACGHFGEGEGELSLDIQQTLTRLEQTGEIPEQVPTVALGGVLLIAALTRTQRSASSPSMAQSAIVSQNIPSRRSSTSTRPFHRRTCLGLWKLS